MLGLLELVITLFIIRPDVVTCNSNCETPVSPHTGVCYWYESTAATWADAYKSCYDQNGRLAIINDSITETFLNTELTTAIPIEVWIGLSDGHTFGTYRWTNTRALADNYQTWKSNPTGGGVKNCVFRKSQEWTPLSCAESKNYICQSYDSSLPIYQCDSLADGCLGITPMEWTEQSNCPRLGTAYLDTDRKSEFTGVTSLDDCKSLCRQRVDFNCTHVKYSESADVCVMFSDRWGGNTFTTLTCSSDYKWHKGRAGRAEGLICFDATDTQTYTLAEAKTHCQSVDGDIFKMANKDEYDFMDYRRIQGDELAHWFNGKTTDGVDYNLRYFDDTYPELSIHGVHDSASYSECNYLHGPANQNFHVHSQSCTDSIEVVCEKTTSGSCLFNLKKDYITDATTMTLTTSYDFATGYSTVTATCDVNLEFSVDKSTEKTFTCSCAFATSTYNAGYCSDFTCTFTPTPTSLTCVPIECPEPSLTSAVATVRNPPYYVDETVAFTCNSGLWINDTSLASPVTTMDATCNSNENWDFQYQTQCTPVDCLKPTGAHITNLNSVSTTYSGSAVTLNCDTGHWVTPGTFSQSVICSVTGSWPAIQDCVVVDCEQPSGTHFGNLGSLDTEYSGSAVTLNCTTGHWVSSGVFTQDITCSDAGSWSSFGSCTVVDCGQPSGPNFNALGSSDTLYSSGSPVTLSCTTGHWVSSGVFTQSITCSNTGSWDSVTSCSLVDCGQPSGSNFITLAPSDTQYSGSAVTLGCITPGYWVSSGVFSQDITCSNEGSWPSVTSCSLVDCEQPSGSNFVVLGSSDTQYSGSPVTLNCTTGHWVSSGVFTQSITCANEGSWPSVTSCTVVDCGQLSVSNVTALGSSDTQYSGSPVTLSCTTGHWVSSGVFTQSITCSDTGSWDSVTSCSLVDCGQPSGSNFVSLGSSNTQYSGSPVTLSCTTGHWVSPGVFTQDITCSNEGSWPSVTSCSLVDCEQPSGSNFVALGSSDTQYSGSPVTLSCTTGHWVSSGVFTQSITCSNEGLWPSVTTCTVVDCEQPIVSNVNALAQTQYSGSAVTLNCITPGYWVSSGMFTQDITCSNEGSWDSVTSCSLVDCGQPSGSNFASLGSSDTKYSGSAVTLNCTTGHWVSSGVFSQDITCSNEGSWPSVTSCSLIDCAAPTGGNISNLASVTTTYSGNPVTLSCDTGFWVSQTELSSQSVTCLDTGSWSAVSGCTAIPENIVDCGVPTGEHIGNLGSVNSIYSNESPVNLICKTGYWLSLGVTTQNAICSISGNWSAIQNCTIVDCGIPSGLIYSSIQAHTGNEYMDNTTYECITGHYFAGSNANTSTITCMADGDWSSIVDCIAKNCSTPPAIPNSDQSSTGTLYSNTTTYDCHTGYYLPDELTTDTITCLEDGSWEHIDNCTIVSCGNPPEFTYSGIQSHTGKEYLDNATYECTAGYSFAWNNVTISMITCLADGNWTSISDCTAVDCASPPGLIYSSIQSHTGNEFMDNTTYECVTGHYFAGDNMSNGNTSTITCMADGDWSAIVDCIAKNCSTPPDVPNSDQSSTGTLYSNTTTYDCHTGHYLPGRLTTGTITCLEDGTWEHIDNCTIVNCGNPPEFTYSSIQSLTGTEYLDNATHECTLGHAFAWNNVTISTITCMADGNWSYIDDCKAKNCSNPPAIPNSDQSSTGTLYSNTTTYDCHTGYYLPGRLTTDTITCSEGGSWEHIENCTIVNCGNPPVLNNSTIQSTTGNEYLDNVTYECGTDRYFVGNNAVLNTISMISCMADGNWSSINDCTVVSCGNPPGLTYSSKQSHTGNKYLDNATYECTTGHVFTWNNVTFSTITCMADGNWSHIDDCKAKNCSTPPDIPNSNQSSTGTLYSNITTYDCHTGYYLPDRLTTDTITCLEDGEWEHIENCTIVNCGNISKLNYSTIQSQTGNEYLDNVTYECIIGYYFVRNNVALNTITCMADGNWSSINDCIAADCNLPPDTPANTYIVNQTGDWYIDNITYACDTGYRYASGSITSLITCQANASWSQAEDCIIVDCGPAPVFDNTNIVITNDNASSCNFTTNTNSTLDNCTNSIDSQYNATLYTNKTTYVCDSYRFFSTGELRKVSECQADGNWSITEGCSEHYNITCVNDYNGTTYDFDTAKNTCLSQGLSMYKVTSEIVQQALQIFIANNNVTRPWLGLEKVGSTWYWLDGTELDNVLYNNWAPNQTNLTHDCAVITHIAVPGMPIYSWLSTDCVGSSYSLICTNDPDDECQKYLPHIHHTTKQTENGEVLYTCNENSSFADGTSNKSVICGCGDDVKPLINEILSWGWCHYPGVNVEEASTTQALLETTTYSSTTTGTNSSTTTTSTPVILTTTPQRKLEEASTTQALLETTTYSSTTTGTNSSTTTTSTPVILTTTPQRKSLRCRDPPGLYNVDIVDSYPIAGGYITYSCKLGYEFADGTTLRTFVCDDSKVPLDWHVPVIDCQAKNCQTLDPDIETCAKTSSSHSKSLVPDIEESSSSISISAGEGLDCSCRDSAEMFNTGIEQSGILCENLERWTPHPGQCGPNCPPLPVIDNSVVLDYYNYHSIGTELSIQCNRGHRFIDGQTTKTLRCNEDRTWSDIGDCEIDICPTLALPINSTINATAVIFGTYVNVSCDPGYTYSPGSWYLVNECLDGGVWNISSIPDCIEIECSSNHTVENALRTGTGTSYGSVLNYECLTGYGLTIGNPEDTYRTETGHLHTSVTCQQDSQWSIQTLTCELGRCPPVPSYLHSSPDSHLALNGSRVNITAEEGYIFIGEVNGKFITIQCMTSKWNVPNVTVAAIECIPLPSIGHTNRNSSVSNYLSVIMYTCNAGYSLLGNNTLTEIIVQCSDNGWEALYPEDVTDIPTECAPVNCGTLPPLLHAYAPMDYNTTYGSQATYRAQTGYWHSRGNYFLTVECAQNGEWTPTPTNFTKITCPTLPTWSGMISNSSSTNVNAIINATCGSNQRGDSLALDTQRVWLESLCSDNGDWYPPIPSCIIQNRAPAFTPPPAEADGADMIGIIAGLFIAAVFSLLLFIDSITILVMYQMGQLFPALLQEPRNINSEGPSSFHKGIQKHKNKII